ncbi:hypothetical protein P3T76_010545 [Phytophthora citrophthora]|uniref:Uncharacterized protein n=1 Tax=Phytophthora citrophthora TaxID=4793 RepID=A0AAD9GCP9_9STRA|nr:hypothetical protein P3T76_010545 [Phytophthora citrophthora]
MDQRKASIPDFHKRLATIRFNQAAETKKAARVLDLTRTGSGVAVSGEHAGDSKKSGAARLVIRPMSPTKSTKASGSPPLKPTRPSGNIAFVSFRIVPRTTHLASTRSARRTPSLSSPGRLFTPCYQTGSSGRKCVRTCAWFCLLGPLARPQ